MTERDDAAPAVYCASPAEHELYRVAYRYFLNPDENGLAQLERQVLLREGNAMCNAALVMQAANDELDEECQKIVEIITRQGAAIACHAGCTGCCHQLVLCHPFEAVLIGKYIQPRPVLREFFLEAWQKWDAATASFRDSYLAWAEQLYRNGVDDGTHQLLDYYVPCPFLDNGRCRIYPVRPYACRSSVAVSAECAQPRNPNEKPGMHNMELGAHTPHKKARQAVVNLLWKTFGADLAESKPCIMPNLVHFWLQSDEDSAFRTR